MEGGERERGGQIKKFKTRVQASIIQYGHRHKLIPINYHIMTVKSSWPKNVYHALTPPPVKPPLAHGEANLGAANAQQKESASKTKIIGEPSTSGKN